MENTDYGSIEFPGGMVGDLGLDLSAASSWEFAMAQRILAEVRAFRRIPTTRDFCENSSCHICCAMHLPQVLESVRHNKPVSFVLPAFPGKSPNLEKVLGPLPDLAEKLSLDFLGSLSRRVKTYYVPGIQILLCSDGRVFSDVVGMKESHVSVYQSELRRLLSETTSSGIKTFNLEDVYGTLCYSKMRDELMKDYGSSLDCLKYKISQGAKVSAKPEEKETNRLYCGITRFLFEDALYSGQTKSRTAIQKESRSKALEVIRRSNAWSQLIAKEFPQAVRLSIHPQTCGSRKLGIRLIGNEIWMTPWHGVAVETPSGYILLKRSNAEALGAKLIYDSDGRPSHYSLLHEKTLGGESLKGIDQLSPREII